MSYAGAQCERYTQVQNKLTVQKNIDLSPELTFTSDFFILVFNSNRTRVLNTINLETI